MTADGNSRKISLTSTWASSCAEAKRIFDHTCPARRNCTARLSTSSGLKTTIASHRAPPFLVAPNDRMSMPTRDLAQRTNFVERIDRAKIARLGQVDRRRLAAMQLARGDRCDRLGQSLGADPPMLTGDRRQL